VTTEVGYPQVSLTYAQGLDEWNDLAGPSHGLDHRGDGARAGVAARARRRRGKPGRVRLAAGPWLDFGATWIYPRTGPTWACWWLGSGLDRLDRPGLVSVTLDLGIEWAMQRGMGVGFVPRLGVAYEAPVSKDVTLELGPAVGALGLGKRPDPGPGRQAPRRAGRRRHLEGLLRGLPAGDAGDGRAAGPVHRLEVLEHLLGLDGPGDALGDLASRESMNTTVACPPRRTCRRPSGRPRCRGFRPS